MPRGDGTGPNGQGAGMGRGSGGAGRGRMGGNSLKSRHIITMVVLGE